ncbi:MAG: ParB N-terminal domain-containing protein [Spirochaetales bacterium]|nr:ParB N-terminal domain-containing protein [Spirochaetales bacterium]HNQ96872.1 ParB N-terminal domain-containing protein [Treponemataceae bacterium]
MQVALEEIKIRKRVRRKNEDIEPLMDSMKRYGLFNPITINSRMVLVAGARRLEAAKRLGWRTINAVMLDDTDKITELEIELEENVQRSNFTDRELIEAYARLERMRNPNIFIRIWRAIVAFFHSLFVRN